MKSEKDHKEETRSQDDADKKSRGPRGGKYRYNGNNSKQRKRHNKYEGTKSKFQKRDKRNVFQGTVEEMKGHVFQLRSEAKSILQFKRSQEQLVRYANKKFKRCDDIKYLIRNLKEKKFVEPEEPEGIVNPKVREKIFEKRIDLYVSKCDAYEENKSTLWETI